MTSQPIVAVLVNLPVAERLSAGSTTLVCFAASCYAYFYWSFRLPWGVSLSSACSFLVIFADCKNILRCSCYEKGAPGLKCCDGVRSGACFGFWPKSTWAGDSSCVTSEFLAFDCELAMPTDTYSEYILITVLSHTLCCCNLVSVFEWAKPAASRRRSRWRSLCDVTFICRTLRLTPLPFVYYFVCKD